MVNFQLFYDLDLKYIHWLVFVSMNLSLVIVCFFYVFKTIWEGRNRVVGRLEELSSIKSGGTLVCKGTPTFFPIKL
jgi:hypothetical protein